MEFTPRLMQILFLLLNAGKPIPAAKLAEQLQISKRTIFRELDNVEISLRKYGLKLERKSRTGFELTGDTQDKQRLLEELQQSDHFDPRNREERQQKLILAMMKEDELQKLFYYADMLKVSEPTISKDLETLEEWFQRQNILLLRRAGFGVGLVYKEEDYRKALLAYASKYQDHSFIDSEIYDKITYIVNSTGKNIMDKLTRYSVRNFLLYTAISVQRIQKQKYIADIYQSNEIQHPKNYEFIYNLAVIMEKEFKICIGKNEVYALYIFLQGCKYQYIQREGECLNVGNGRINIKDMIYEMANAFDPAAAYELKDDADFMVSTFPIDSTVENIYVDPMLSENDLKKIAEKIEFYAWKEKKDKPVKNNINVYEATLITNEINSIIKGFDFKYLKETISFTEALLQISDYFTEDEAKKDELYKDFSEREALSTQVIEEFEIIFLHARTAIVEQSQFIVALPEGEYFKDPYFKKARAIIVMLIPKDDPRPTLAVSSISNEMFEDEQFLEDVKCGNQEVVFPRIKTILESYFDEYLRSIYDRER